MVEASALLMMMLEGRRNSWMRVEYTSAMMHYYHTVFHPRRHSMALSKWSKKKKANMSFCLLGIFNCQMVGCICSVFEWLNFSLSCTICLPQVRNTSVELAICWPNSGTRPSPKQHHLPTLSPSAKWRWRHFGHLCHSSEHTGTHYLWGVIALVGN